MNKRFSIPTLIFLCITTFSINAQKALPSAEENGNLRFVGNLKAANRTVDQITPCLSDWLSLTGLDSISNEGKHVFFTGKHDYTYSINLEERAGEISFKYIIKVRDGILIYRFYDFEHIQGDSEYESVGDWPLEWNEKVKPSFTQSQFHHILFEIKFNIAHLVKVMNKHCM